ncbi:potassium channel family protein [Pelomonas sp. SE-A7]|uniref:potassium channel family protein n=1 Tax=Pelomonas sp. SE-A7 TaxID=3054953 RepID=UPI00259C85AB|nr:potassium channel family protein [Pelomonas sp. SE-A7]MDM4767906.1 potassium channel family protein [Pelomonas sp. SE-A7]
MTTSRHRIRRWGWLPAETPGNSRAHQIADRWRWPLLAALLCTIPAFYIELLENLPTPLAVAIYAGAAALMAVAGLHLARHSGEALNYWRNNLMDLILIVGLLLAATLPPSIDSHAALAARLLVAFLTLARIIWAIKSWVTRGGLPYLLLLSLAVLLFSGVGFWALEPRVKGLGEGLWLAFTTAATVGYGDLVPTTPAARIFAVFVVLLGYAVLSLVTAAIAARWVESTEREVERDILRDLHGQVRELRQEIQALRERLDA